MVAPLPSLRCFAKGNRILHPDRVVVAGGPHRGGEGKDGWMDGWCENSGGNSLGHGPAAPISRSSRQQRFFNSGLADPWNLGSCMIELVTCQLMVGHFGQLSPLDYRRMSGHLNHLAPCDSAPLAPLPRGTHIVLPLVELPLGE